MAKEYKYYACYKDSHGNGEYIEKESVEEAYGICSIKTIRVLFAGRYSFS